MLARAPKAILRAHDVEQIVVDDAAVVDAMRVVWERTKQLIEPSAAVAFARPAPRDLDGARVGIICSGGNVDLDALPGDPVPRRVKRRGRRAG